jgi:hypothetical protein
MQQTEESKSRMFARIERILDLGADMNPILRNKLIDRVIAETLLPLKLHSIDVA